MLKHILEKINIKADILLRKDQVNTKEDNKDVQLLKEQLWTKRTTAEITILGRKTIMDELNITKGIRRNNIREQEVVQVLKKKDGLTWEEDGIIYMKERIYIPNNKKIKEQILKENYDLVDVGHSGQQWMIELIK